MGIPTHQSIMKEGKKEKHGCMIDTSLLISKLGWSSCEFVKIKRNFYVFLKKNSLRK